MRILRLCLLVFLAVLLPVRGAVAAAMLCPVGGSSAQVEMSPHPQDEHHHAMGDAAEHDHGAMHDAQTGGGHHGDSATADKCNMCSAFCSMTPLPSQASALVEPLDAATVSFPDLAAPAPSFLSGGQERPPRSI